MNTPFRLRKKILFSIITTVIFFTALEVAARCYHYSKYKNPEVFLHGKNFIEQSLRGQENIITNPYLTQEDAEADKFFEDRHDIKSKSTDEPNKCILENDSLVYKNKSKIKNEDILSKKDPDVIRIIAMGGSFVRCHLLKDTASWEYLLNEKLKGSSKKYEIINGGMCSYCITNLLYFLIQEVVHFDPDYIILFTAYNNHRYLSQQLSLSWKICTTINNLSMFSTLVYYKIAQQRMKNYEYFADYHFFNVDATKSDVEKVMDLYKKRLNQILIVCQEHNIKLILGLQPEVIPYKLKELQNLLDEKKIIELGEKLEKQRYLSYYELEYYLQGRFNLEMKKFAEENGVLLFDGVSIFPENESSYFIDQIHLNERGTALFAEGLYRFLIKNNVADTTGDKKI